MIQSMSEFDQVVSMKEENAMLREELLSMSNKLSQKEVESTQNKIILKNFVRNERKFLLPKQNSVSIHEKNGSSSGVSGSESSEGRGNHYHQDLSNKTFSTPTHSLSSYSSASSSPRNKETIAQTPEKVKLNKLEHFQNKSPYYTSSSIKGSPNLKILKYMCEEISLLAWNEESNKRLNLDDVRERDSLSREQNIAIKRLKLENLKLKSQIETLYQRIRNIKGDNEDLVMVNTRHEYNMEACKKMTDIQQNIITLLEVLFALKETKLQILSNGVNVNAEDCRNEQILLENIYEETDVKFAKLPSNLEDILGNSGSQQSIHSSYMQDESMSMNLDQIKSYFNEEDEKMLKEYVNDFKKEILSLRRVLTVSDALSNPKSSSKNYCTSSNSLNVRDNEVASKDKEDLNLENSLLFQEITTLKEELAECQARAFVIENEKKSMMCLINEKTCLEKALKMNLKNYQEKTSDYEEIESQISSFNCKEEKCSLAEREAHKYKVQVKELLTLVDNISLNSERRHFHSMQFINELKKSNKYLLQALSQSKG